MSSVITATNRPITAYSESSGRCTDSNSGLKERSPSCGSGTIYDGSFTGTVIPGDGVAAEKLRAAGLTLYGESELEKLI